MATMMSTIHGADQDLDLLLDGLSRFVKREVLARHEGHAELLSDPRLLFDERGRYVEEAITIIRDVREVSARAGFFNMCVPESLGGGGLGYLAYFEAWKLIFHMCSPHEWLSHFALSHWASGPSVALEGLTEGARDRALPGLMGGREIMCFGMSEPEAGSDARAMRTRARRVPEGWRIDGRKIWTSYAPIADWMLLFAVTDGAEGDGGPTGTSAFIVPMSSSGVEVHSVIRMFGEVGGIEGEVALEDVLVEDWQLVGEVDRGLAIAMSGVSLGRIYNAARACGIGRWALDRALDHVDQREAFGKRLAEHQAVMHPLAESAAELRAAHVLAIDTAQRLDSGEASRVEVAMTKLLATRAGLQAVDRAMQAFGAMGFTNSMGLSEGFVELRKARVADGTDEILLRTISKGLTAGERPF